MTALTVTFIIKQALNDDSCRKPSLIAILSGGIAALNPRLHKDDALSGNRPAFHKTGRQPTRKNKRRGSAMEPRLVWRHVKIISWRG